MCQTNATFKGAVILSRRRRIGSSPVWLPVLRCAQQLSQMSSLNESWLPRNAGPGHRVKDAQELAHARGERQFGWFTGESEPGVEALKNLIAANGYHRGHEQRGPNGRSAAPDHAPTPELS